MVNSFLNLTKIIQGEPIDKGSEWKNDAQMLSIKCAKSAISLNHLAGCLHVLQDERGQVEFIDHSSVAILGRSVFEASLALNYAFCHTSPEVREFRYLLWVYGGLFERSKITPLTEHGKERKSENEILLLQKKEEIINNPFFEKFDKNKKRNVISSGNWRPEHAWIDIAEMAGYDRKYFSNIYNFLSGHAHASYISVLQTRDAAYSIDDQGRLSSSVRDMCAVVIAKLALDYVRIFPKAEVALLDDKALHEAFIFWSSLASQSSY